MMGSRLINWQTYNGVAETVLTYPAYYKNAAKLFLAKRAKVILSSATPNK
jgi:rhamnogalacturonan acetylesterase